MGDHYARKALGASIKMPLRPYFMEKCHIGQGNRPWRNILVTHKSPEMTTGRLLLRPRNPYPSHRDHPARVAACCAPIPLAL